jgi:hypothetical protein
LAASIAARFNGCISLPSLAGSFHFLLFMHVFGGKLQATALYQGKKAT